MSGINPIQGSVPIFPRSGAATGGGGGATRADFGKQLRSCIEKVNGDQQSSDTAIQDLLSGRSEDILPTVASVAKADLSFKLLIGVRNKVIEAYKQTMNMQV